MKTIDEKLMIVGLVVDIESKINFTEFRSSKIMFLVNVSLLVKSNRQWYVSYHICDLKRGLLYPQD